MKKISEVEEKPFTSSLKISVQKPAVESGERAGGVTPPPLTTTYFPADHGYFI